MRRKDLLEGCLGLLLVPVIFFVIFYAINRGELKAEKFSEVLSQYGSAYGHDFPAGEPIGSLPVPVKAIFVSQIGTTNADKTVTTYHWIGDNAYTKIPKGLRAETPEELNTLIFISRGLRQEGYYTGGGRAYINLTTIFILNLGTNQVVARKTFEGGPPPGSKASSGDGYGSSPDSAAFNWAITYIQGNLEMQSDP